MPVLDDQRPMEVYWRGIFETEMAWVAQQKNQIVGFCVRDKGDENNIGALYVVRKARNGGIGKRLPDLAKDNRSHITVWAYEANVQARKFYRREGFIEVSREFDVEANLVDIEHRWKRLPYR
ncbi:MAG: GNAT family N-acetyltransferase [Granulosicoccus sp.]